MISKLIVYMFFVLRINGNNRSGIISEFRDNNFIHLNEETLSTMSKTLSDNEVAIIDKLNISLTNCFGTPYSYKSYLELIPNEHTEYFLIFGVPTGQTYLDLVFSVSYVFSTEEQRLEVYSVCKTDSSIAKEFRVSDFLYKVNSDFFTVGFTKVWLGVLFSNPIYERVVTSYLRAGFDVKYVSSIGSQEKSNYSGRFLVMEAQTGKRAYLPGTPQPFVLDKGEETKMIDIAKNIKLVEYDFLQEIFVRLDSSAWKVFLRQVIVKNKECGGIIRKHIDGEGNVYIDKFSILMGCEGGVDPNEQECTTNQVFSFEINFHTHPIICYNKTQGVTAALGPPSIADYRVVFGQFMEGLHYFHMVVSLEGIYVISVHPYWKYLLEHKKITDQCLIGIDWLIGSINEAYFPISYFTDINEMLKYSNNLMSPNLLMKRYISQKGTNAQLESFKESCLAGGINRNINLFICSFVPYPIKEHVAAGAVLEYIRIMKEHKLMFDQISLDQRVSTVREFLETGFNDVPIMIPYYTINPTMESQLEHLV
jgi:hypothetical protein